MKRFFRELKASLFITSIICIALGIALVAKPDVSAKVLCIGVGSVLIIVAIINIIIFLISHDGTVFSRLNLTVGIIFAAIGIFIVLSPQIVITIVPVIIGIFITIHGLNDLKQSYDLLKGEYRRWYLALVFAILTIILGVVIIINPFKDSKALIIMVGISLIIDGASDFFIALHVYQITRRAKKEWKKQLKETKIFSQDNSLIDDESIEK